MLFIVNQLILLFWKLVDQTKISKPQDFRTLFKQILAYIFLSVRAYSDVTFQYEIPCKKIHATYFKKASGPLFHYILLPKRPPLIWFCTNFMKGHLLQEFCRRLQFGTISQLKTRFLMSSHQKKDYIKLDYSFQ